MTACSRESDEELLGRYANGEDGAFEALFHRHAPRVFAYLARLLGDREVAADLTQETFLRLLRTARESPGPANLPGFLYTVATNLARDHFRRLRARSQALLAGESPLTSPQPAAPDPRRDRLIQEAVAALPAEQRAVLLLRCHQGLTFAEIAQVTGASLSAVKARMRYAVARLRRSLGPLLQGECQ